MNPYRAVATSIEYNLFMIANLWLYLCAAIDAFRRNRAPDWDRHQCTKAELRRLEKLWKQ